MRPIARGSRKHGGDLGQLVSLDDRLALRVSRLWDDIAGHRLFPSKDQINQSLIGGDWANCALIDLHHHLEKSILIMVGDNLLPSPECTLDGRPLLKCPTGALLAIVASHLLELTETRAPLTLGGVASHLGTPILYRGALLPLAEDGMCMDGVLVAANYRKVGS